MLPEECKCELAGFCNRHQMRKTQREVSICKGTAEGLSCKVMDSYRRNWEANIRSPQAIAGGKSEPSAPRVTCKAGTELKKLLAWFGVTSSSSCNCDNHANLMDSKGCSWCRQNIETIVEWMADEASKRQILGFSLDRVPGFTFTARGLVETAIAKAEDTAAYERNRKGSFPALTLIPLGENPTEHIIYHLLPLGGEAEGVWRGHCDRLKAIRPDFSGRLVISLNSKTDDSRHRPEDVSRFEWLTPEHVMNYLADVPGVEFVVSENDSVLGEGPGFQKALELLETTDSNTIVYYGHAKGVTRKKTEHPAAHAWGDAMFETLFANQSGVRAALSSSGICGSFRMRGHLPPGPGVGQHWFYSGTFFAFRAADVYPRDWRKMTSYYGCVEQWPRIQFPLEQSACLFWDDTTNLYDWQYWNEYVFPALVKWREDHSEVGICTKPKTRLPRKSSK